MTRGTTLMVGIATGRSSPLLSFR